MGNFQQTMWVVVVGSEVRSWHRKEAAARKECMRLRRTEGVMACIVQRTAR